MFANDAIGNFVMATPLLQLLRSELRPASIHYFGGTRTRELQEASDLFEVHTLLHGADAGQMKSILERAGEFDLLVNLESTAFSKTAVGLLAGSSGFVAGPSIGPGGRGELPFPEDARGDLWRDKGWIAEDLAERYPFLNGGFIAEIFARLCYLTEALPPYRIPVAEPERDVPPVLIATAASLPEKLWPVEHWRYVLSHLKESGISAGLLGAPRSQQAKHWKGASMEDELVAEGWVQDLRGQFSLPQVAGALQAADAVLTLDNGILHLATAVGARTVGLYRHGIHRLWAPPVACLRVLTPGEGAPVSEIAPETVWEAVLGELA